MAQMFSKKLEKLSENLTISLLYRENSTVKTRTLNLKKLKFYAENRGVTLEFLDSVCKDLFQFRSF